MEAAEAAEGAALLLLPSSAPLLGQQLQRGTALTVCCRSGIPMRTTTVLPVGSSMGPAAAAPPPLPRRQAWLPPLPLSSSRQLPLSAPAPRLPSAACE